MAFFGASRVEGVADLVYSKPLGKAEIAAFATETARVATDGDAVARELYARAGAELGAQILVVIRHAGLGGEGSQPEEPFPVGLIGGAFKAGSLFVDPLTATVTARAPRARVAQVGMAPVGGSLLLAARACGRTFARAELSRALDAVVPDSAG
jgi:N-acetylglucosamine kinase-like BadF-type ATPase